MSLSKRSNGIYYLWFYDEVGRRQKVSTGCTLKSDALKFLRDFKEGEKRVNKGLARKSLSEFFADYQEFARSIHTIKTQSSSANAFRELIRITGDIRLDKLGVKDIETFLAQKKGEASAWTARKYYIALASAFETAKRWKYISSNPFRNVQKPKTSEVLPCYLTKIEMYKLLSVIESDRFRDLYLFALFTGLRQGELLNLRWSHIDLLSSVVHVRNSETFTTKNKKNRSIPINDQLRRIAEEMKARASSELVFHDKGKLLSAIRISKAFKFAIRKAGLNDKLHFHSLRHTFASWLVQGGVSIYDVQKLLGHSSVKVTEVYSHLAASELHSSVNKINLGANALKTSLD